MILTAHPVAWTGSTVLSFVLALRALRWRAAASATVFAVALVGITAGAVGPIYLHAVDQAVLSQRLTHAPQSQRDLRIQRETTIGAPRAIWSAAIRQLAGYADDSRWFDPPVYSENAPVTWKGQVTYGTELAALDHLCRNVHVVSGHCLSDNATDEAVITARTAQSQRLKVGDVLRPDAADTPTKLAVRIVGIVAPVRPHGTFWTPWPYLNAADSVFSGDLPKVDAFFVSHRLLQQHQRDITQIISANLELRAADIRTADIGPLRARLHSVQTAAARTTSFTSTSVPSVGSGLPSVLNAMQSEMARARTLVVLATAQLVLLAIAVLYAVVAGTTAATANEVALAKLRGRRSRTVLAQGLGQPVLLVLLAAPVAALLAWLVVKTVAGHLIGASADVAFPASALVVVLVVTTASLVAAAVAARRIFQSPIGQLLHRGTDASASRVGLLLADVGTLALAAAAVLEIASTGTVDAQRSTNPLSAVAAIMLGAAIGVLVVRALPLVGRAALRATRDSPKLTSFLAVRQIVRRPAGARVIVLVGIALALATFSVIGWSVASTNRDLRAQAQSGAHEVLYVRPHTRTTDLRAAVDAADPGGHTMAAAVVRVEDGTPLLAVDTTRFSGVAAWSAHNSTVALPTLLTSLRSATVPSIAVPGSVLRLSVTARTLPAHAKVTLRVVLTGADHIGTGFDFGRVHPGHQNLQKTVSPLCTAPCRITELALAAQPAGKRALGRHAAIDATVSASAIGSGASRPVPGFADPARWRPDSSGSARLTPSEDGGLSVQLEPDDTGSWPTLLSRDTPAVIPAVVASGTATTYGGNSIHDVSAFGLDSVPVSLNGFATAVSLPMLDRTGVLVDLDTTVLAMRAGLTRQTQYAVFASAAAPSDLAARLRAHGLTVTRTVRASTYRDRLDHAGPALADGLFLVAAGAAGLLAIGATVLGAVVTARRRAYESAALEAAGVDRRTLRRATAAEQLVLLLCGLAVGLAGGLIGARLALPSMPIFVSQSIGPPIIHDVPFGLLGALTVATAAVFALTAAVVAGVVSRQADAGRLREAPA